MVFSSQLSGALFYAERQAKNFHSDIATPEHLLYVFLNHREFTTPIRNFGISTREFKAKVKLYLIDQEDVIVSSVDDVVMSSQLQMLFIKASNFAQKEDRELIRVADVANAMFDLQDSQAAYMLNSAIGDNREKFITLLVDTFDDDDLPIYDSIPEKLRNIIPGNIDDDDFYDDDFDDNNNVFDINSFSCENNDVDGDKKTWMDYALCINDNLAAHNPLIGREAELERTIQVLCRKDKNNPLHVGEPGVGKTSLIYGLAALIEKGQVPDKLKDARIYSVDVGQLLAGTQYRGDFEKRIHSVMEGASSEKNSIIYFDEIHNLVGAGRGSDGGPDAANIIKPYLESKKLRFIGSTTYEEYNRSIAKSKSLVRRFQQIDIAEPTVDEAIEIVMGLVPTYQKFHNVVYRRDVVEYAVRAAAKHISNRYLPDKAIDLIDEAGAYLQIHPNKNTSRQVATNQLINQILAKICKLEAQAIREEGTATLKTLRERVAVQIFGQERAVDNVVEAVMMAKAGLVDDNKPLASLLFVGPTGVGKTEVARVLARELGVELVRFDMSEYAEKHAVAKLIGSPAGYVGYEDGGLLTDAITKSPNCVLLLDEIEKAHSDIYNILLQVMDYACLTDNRGRKADFRQVILIMTSNAGAEFASMAKIGFGSTVTRGDAMLRQVKKIFKPEFINRLSATVVFNDMNRQMAQLILRKKLKQLEEKLKARKVTLRLTDEAEERLLQLGFTPEYGAREMDRVINSRLKTLLMREILFGSLQKGGTATVNVDGDDFRVEKSEIMKIKA